MGKQKTSTPLGERLETKETALAAGAGKRADDVWSWYSNPTTENQLAKALPRGIEPSRFSRMVHTELTRNPKLYSADVRTFVLSVFAVAQLGLELGPLGQAYLVPFKNKQGILEVNVIVGYKGLKELAYRSDTVDYIDAVTVHEGEPFTVRKGSDPLLVHEEIPACSENPAVAYYAIAFPKGGGRPAFDVMYPHQIEAIRKSAKAGDVAGSPWDRKVRGGQDYEAMAQKTVTRRLLNRGKVRLTPQAQGSMALADVAEFGKRSELRNLLEPALAELVPPAPATGEDDDEPTTEPTATAEPKSEPTQESPTVDVGTMEGGPQAACAICGAVEDAAGHIKHDDAKHEAAAAEKRKAKEVREVQAGGGITVTRITPAQEDAGQEKLL